MNIPNSVTSIGDHAFYECSGLTSITIPNSVTSIGDYAFSGCSGLTTVTIPNSVTTIGRSAFSGTAWYNNQPDGLVYAGKVAYKYKGTMPEETEIIIQDGTLGIAGYTFWGCSSLTSIDIPSSVTSIGEGAFLGCSSLTSVTIPNSVTTIGRSTFLGCSSLTSITIPENVTSIGSEAFMDCSGLTSVTIPESVTSIGYAAFMDCSSLTSITIPESVTSIGSRAFGGTAWYNNQPDGLVYAGKVAYKYKGTMPEGTEIILKDGTSEIADHAFYGCSGLTSVTIPESVTSIDNYAFYGCSGLTSVTIPNSVTSIGGYAFDGCSGLTSVTIPNSVTRIGSGAFYDCSSLTSITIPESVTSIGSNFCPSTTSIYTSFSKILVSLWAGGYDNIKETGTGKSFDKPSLSARGTASSIILSVNNYDSRLTNVITAFGMQKSFDGEEITLSGLDSDTEYDQLVLKVSLDGATYTAPSFSAKTDALTLTTQQPKVISAGNAVVAATSNLDDEETNVGFEWRRIDWTDDFASNTGVAYLYEGTMEGYIRNLYTEKLWKYRPFYESNSGNRYYGEWVGINPTNTNYFEPTVHTYASINVQGNRAEVKGYAMRGTDRVTSQGFMYWKNTSSYSLRKKAASIPSDAITVEVSGNVMTAALEDLDYETAYCYVAFVKTEENETFFGEVQTFNTSFDPDGIGEVRASEDVVEVARYDIQGRMIAKSQKGINIIRNSDGTTKKVLMK